MKTMVISYSLTGNNQDLATNLATALGAEHVRITEPKPRTMGTIVLDMLFNRTPKIQMPAAKTEEQDLVLFVGPVWMGHIATPFRACFKQLGQKIGAYGFISICGGADGPNVNLEDELKKRLLREPACFIEMHIADLLPSEPKPTRNDTMAYRIHEHNVQDLTDTILAQLPQAMLGPRPEAMEGSA